ncbi:MAG: tetratricopeptide repeat protein [bacterium]|nr:tetratricopeptide repeat protein [bacterium]
MNRDSLMFLVIGTLVGFIAGYVMHEVMAARQPAPLRPGQTRSAAPANPPQATAPAAGGAASGSQPAMEQVQRLRAYVEENPNDAEAVRQLADLNYDISNWQRAAELYGRYLELEPDNLDVMTDLGACYRFLGQPRDALALFRQVRERAPDHWRARYNEVLVLGFDLDDFEAAKTAMAQLQLIQPGNSQVSRLAAELAKRSQGT